MAVWDGASWTALGSSPEGMYSAGPIGVYAGDLIVAGSLTSGIPGIMRWNGGSWNPLDPSMNGYTHALGEHDGKLIVGGTFASAGNVRTGCIASWDGSAWHALTSTPVGAGTDNIVSALATFQGKTIAGGAFTQVGDEPIPYIAAWDGVSWSALGSGTDGAVGALAVYNGDLIAAGEFTMAGGIAASNIARWDGTSWHALDVGLDGWVHLLTVHDGLLIAAGEFTSAGGTAANHIASWNGITWQPLGSGLGSIPGWMITSMVSFDGSLIVGGSFTQGDGAPADHITRWNGVTWLAIPEGLPGDVGALTVHAGELYAASPFSGVQRWDGASWGPVGQLTNSVPVVMGTFDGKLVVAGYDFEVEGPLGPMQPGRIAAWDGAQWQPLTTGIIGTVVLALAPQDSSLYVGGLFTGAGGKSSYNIARWDGGVVTSISLQDLSATIRGGTVLLSWTLSPISERSILDIDVERSANRSGHYVSISRMLKPIGTMSFVDSTCASGATCWYRLRVLQIDGSESYFGPVSVTIDDLHRKITLYTPYVPPDTNPIVIRYETRSTERLTQLGVYDARGRCLRTFHDGSLEAGYHISYWDRRTDSGASITRGVYFVRLNSGRLSTSKKFVVR